MVIDTQEGIKSSNISIECLDINFSREYLHWIPNRLTYAELHAYRKYLTYEKRSIPNQTSAISMLLYRHIDNARANNVIVVVPSNTCLDKFGKIPGNQLSQIYKQMN